VLVNIVCVCLGDCGLPLALFQVDFRVLVWPNHVYQGGVQKTTPQVTLYKPHTAKESLRRHRAGSRMKAFSSVSPLTEDGSTSIDVLPTPKMSS
jgi:hypothetical protein